MKVQTVSVESGAVTSVWLTATAEGEGERLVEAERGWTAEGDDAYDAFQSLQASLEHEVRFLCCGGCCFFQVTGMSRQMGGNAGYCLVYFPTHGRTLDDVVSGFDFCDRFVHCAGGGTDEARMQLWESANRRD